MNIVGDLIKYIQSSERLIVVSITLFLSGVAAWWGERIGLFDFAALPTWVRPAIILLWITAGMHTAVRLSISLGTGLKIVGLYTANLPRRRRQAAANQHVIDRLLGIRGLAKEVLCFARYREDNHIWTDGRSEPVWLAELKEAGLVELTHAVFGSAQ